MGDDCEIAPRRDTKIVNCQLSIVNCQFTKAPHTGMCPLSIPHPAEENKRWDFGVEKSLENRYDIAVRECLSYVRRLL